MQHVIQQKEIGVMGRGRWRDTVEKESDETQKDRRHTHVGLIFQSGWSDRSSPSGSTQCPFQRSSEAANGQGDEKRLVV